MDDEPVFVGGMREHIPRGSVDCRGWSEGWAAPVAFVDAPNGFGEETWHIKPDVTLLAWRVSGSVVLSEMPSSLGRSSGLGPHHFNLQIAGVPARYRAPGSVKFCQFYVTDDILGRVAEGIQRPDLSASSLRDDLIMADDRELRELLDTYARRSRDRPHPPSRIELEARALLVVEHLLTRYHNSSRQAPARGGLAPWQLRRVCDAMEARLDSDLGLDDLAAMAGCSPTHFSRAFKQSMGLPPFRWLADRRIAEAKVLLEENKLCLAEIALAVGFSAQPQFTTAFGRATGATPSVWRKERQA